jgi:hypothetical protein
MRKSAHFLGAGRVSAVGPLLPGIRPSSLPGVAEAGTRARLEILMHRLAVLVVAASAVSCSNWQQEAEQAPLPAPTPPPLHAPICAHAAEKEAIDVSALLSELQLITLTCHTDKEYNTLIPHLRPALATKEKNLASFFTRAYGKRGRLEHDKYITELANLQSQFRLKSGARFCSTNASMFDQLMPLSTVEELASYAKRKPIQQALAVNECRAAARPKTTPDGKGQQTERAWMSAATVMPAANPPPGYTWGPGRASFVPLQQVGQSP